MGVIWNWNKYSKRKEHFHDKASFPNLVIAAVNPPISFPLMFLCKEFLLISANKFPVHFGGNLHITKGAVPVADN